MEVKINTDALRNYKLQHKASKRVGANVSTCKQKHPAWIIVWAVVQGLWRPVEVKAFTDDLLDN